MKKLLMLVTLGAAHSLVMGGDTVKVRVQKRVETDDYWTIRSYRRNGGSYPDIKTQIGSDSVSEKDVMSTIVVKKDTKNSASLEVYKNGQTLIRIFRGRNPTKYNFAAQGFTEGTPAKKQMLVIHQIDQYSDKANKLELTFVSEYQTPMEKTKLPTVKVTGYKQLKTNQKKKWSVLTMTTDGEFISFTKFKKDTALITDTNPEILAEAGTNVYVFKDDLSKEKAREAFDSNRGECGEGQLGDNTYVCTSVAPLSSGMSSDVRLVINENGIARITTKDKIEEAF